MEHNADLQKAFLLHGRAEVRINNSMEAMPMTSFADMIHLRKALISKMKLPDWMFKKICQRKDQAALTDVEKERFLCAYHMLNTNGTLGQLVEYHSQFIHHMHGNPRFFPWHRVYLNQLEEALHTIHPDVCIPYWDWTKPGEESIPAWLVGATPTVVTPSQTINVVRSPGPQSQLAGIAAGVATVMADTTYNTFWNDLEGIHGMVHVWVGGTMGQIPTAPADPIFWMHHANIDRLWWLWYNSPAGTGKNPPLVGADEIMDPWATTEADTRDILAMGFEYI